MRRWSTASIRTRLTGWYTLALGLMLVVYATATFVAVRHEFLEQLDEQLHDEFETAESFVTPISGPRNPAVWRRREKAFRRLEVVVQLVVELFEKLMPHRHECCGRVYHQHERQRDGIPAGEPNTNRRRGPAQRHGSPSLKTNPTPRTV